MQASFFVAVWNCEMICAHFTKKRRRFKRQKKFFLHCIWLYFPIGYDMLTSIKAILVLVRSSNSFLCVRTPFFQKKIIKKERMII